MQCPICRQTNPSNAKLCEVCGSPLAPRATSADPGAQAPAWTSPHPPAVAWQRPPAPPAAAAPSAAPAQPPSPPPAQAQPARYQSGSFPASYPSSPAIAPPLPTPQPRPAVGAGVAPTVPHVSPSPAAFPDPPKPGDKRTFLVGAAEQEPAAQPVRAVLIELRSPADVSAVHILHAGPNPIGRSADCPVRIEDPQVSNFHATLVIRNDEVSFLDVSANGSLIDGQRVNNGQVTLRHGSLVGLGTRRLIFLLVPDQTIQRIK